MVEIPGFHCTAKKTKTKHTPGEKRKKNMSAAKSVEASLSLSLPTCKMGPRLSAHLPGESLCE